MGDDRSPRATPKPSSGGNPAQKPKNQEPDTEIPNFENLDSPEDLEAIVQADPAPEDSAEKTKVRDLSQEDLDQLQSKLGSDLLKKLKDDYRGEWLHVRSR